jgi:hypothetical protein
VAAGAGYRDGHQGALVSTVDTLAALYLPGVTVDLFDSHVRTLTGSASAMHMGTGLFVNVAAGRQEGNIIWGDMQALHAQAGIERNFFGIGATTAFIEAGLYDFDRSASATDGINKLSAKAGMDSRFWGVGLVQALDGLSADLYVSYRRYEPGSLSGSVDFNGVTVLEGKLDTPDIQTITAGMRIRF